MKLTEGKTQNEPTNCGDVHHFSTAGVLPNMNETIMGSVQDGKDGCHLWIQEALYKFHHRGLVKGDKRVLIRKFCIND